MPYSRNRAFNASIMRWSKYLRIRDRYFCRKKTTMRLLLLYASNWPRQFAAQWRWVLQALLLSLFVSPMTRAQTSQAGDPATAAPSQAKLDRLKLIAEWDAKLTRLEAQPHPDPLEMLTALLNAKRDSADRLSIDGS